MAIKSQLERETFYYPDGTSETKERETTQRIERNSEPDYIKLYTRMWCEFNEIPNQWRELFLQLAQHMSYCDKSQLQFSQIVATGGPIKSSITKALGIGDRQYQKGLAALVEAGALKKISRGYYQVNPTYASKGEWKYNPRLNRGGVEDLVATFRFKDKKVETDFVWADDGEDDEFNMIMRKNEKVTAKDNTVLTMTRITPLTREDGDITTEDIEYKAG